MNVSVDEGVWVGLCLVGGVGVVFVVCVCCVMSVVSMLCGSLFVLLCGSVLMNMSGCGMNVGLICLCSVCCRLVVESVGVMISVMSCVIGLRVVLLCVGVVLFGMKNMLLIIFVIVLS